MQIRPYPVIDPVATGNNIRRLRMERGMSVRELQAYFGFEQPQAIYKWQQGTSLPSVDNLYALGALLEVPMDEILVSTQANITKIGQQEKSCCPVHFLIHFRLSRPRQAAGNTSTIFASVLRINFSVRKNLCAASAYSKFRALPARRVYAEMEMC